MAQVEKNTVTPTRVRRPSVTQRAANGRRQTIVAYKDHDAHSPGSSDTATWLRRDTLDALRMLLDQSTCFESLMKSLALVDEGAVEDDDEEIEPFQELTPEEIKAAQVVFPSAVLRVPSEMDIHLGPMSTIKGQVKAFANERQLSEGLESSLSQLLEDELDADPVLQLCRMQGVLRTICEECPIDREILQKVAEMDFAQPDRCLEKLLKVMALHKRQHSRRHRDKESLFVLIYHGLCFQSQRSPTAGFPMEKMIAFAAYYFPTASLAEVYRVCDGRTSGTVEEPLFLRAISRLAKATEGAADLFADKRCYEAWVLLGGNQDRTGIISADILRLNANVLRIAPQHVEASLSELAGVELTFPVFFGMLAALQNQVIQPRPRSKAVRMKGPSKEGGPHPADAEATLATATPQRQSIYSLRSNDSSPLSFEPLPLEEAETETSSELLDDEPTIQRRFQAIVKRQDELQRTYRRNTRAVHASPFTLHSRILFRRLQNKTGSRPLVGGRHASRLSDEEAALADNVAEFFQKYLLHKATRHSQWDSPYSAANLQHHGYDRLGTPQQQELLASLRAEGVLPLSGRNQRSPSTPQRSTISEFDARVSGRRSLPRDESSVASRRPTAPSPALSRGVNLPPLPRAAP
eukprot:GGOE01054989.1.p1 GENE.GGOE01054989.1~~GGOE01054989.1.p1  ORF type:complete len:636 (-),score=134.42 GGOE01054989.1:223-2130(-)